MGVASALRLVALLFLALVLGGSATLQAGNLRSSRTVAAGAHHGAPFECTYMSPVTLEACLWHHDYVQGLDEDQLSEHIEKGPLGWHDTSHEGVFKTTCQEEYSNICLVSVPKHPRFGPPCEVCRFARACDEYAELTDAQERPVAELDVTSASVCASNSATGEVGEATPSPTPRPRPASDCDGYVVLGAGSEDWNGCYVPGAKSPDGSARYGKDATHMLFKFGGVWRLGVYDGKLYYSGPDTADGMVPPESGWLVEEGGGQGPAPTDVYANGEQVDIDDLPDDADLGVGLWDGAAGPDAAPSNLVRVPAAVPSNTSMSPSDLIHSMPTDASTTPSPKSTTAVSPRRVSASDSVDLPSSFFAPEQEMTESKKEDDEDLSVHKSTGARSSTHLAAQADSSEHQEEEQEEDGDFESMDADTADQDVDGDEETLDSPELFSPVSAEKDLAPPSSAEQSEYAEDQDSETVESAVLVRELPRKLTTPATAKVSKPVVDPSDENDDSLLPEAEEQESIAATRAHVRTATVPPPSYHKPPKANLQPAEIKNVLPPPPSPAHMHKFYGSARQQLRTQKVPKGYSASGAILTHQKAVAQKRQQVHQPQTIPKHIEKRDAEHSSSKTQRNAPPVTQQRRARLPAKNTKHDRKLHAVQLAARRSHKSRSVVETKTSRKERQGKHRKAGARQETSASARKKAMIRAYYAAEQKQLRQELHGFAMSPAAMRELAAGAHGQRQH